jgi:hypothetical protein
MSCLEPINKQFYFWKNEDSDQKAPTHQGLFNAVVVVALVVLFVWVIKLCKKIHNDGMCDNTFKAGYGYNARLEQVAEGGLGTTGTPVYGNIGSTMPGGGGLGTDIYSAPAASPFLGGPESPIFYPFGNDEIYGNAQSKRLSSEGGTVKTAYADKDGKIVPVGSIDDSKIDQGSIGSDGFYEFCTKNLTDAKCTAYKTMYCGKDVNKKKLLCGTSPVWKYEAATDESLLGR